MAIIRVITPGEVPVALLSNELPSPLSGIAYAGTSIYAARADHNHDDSELRAFVNGQVPAVNAAKDSALSAITTDKNSATTAIATDRASALAAILSERTYAVDAILADKDSALAAILADKNSALSSILTDKNSAVSAISTDRSSALAAILADRTAAETSITNMGNAKVADIEAAAAVAFTDITESVFSASVHFTAGSTTSLTLPVSYLSPSSITVHFDSAYQGSDKYTLSGTTITFNAPIPVGVSKVFVKGGRVVETGVATVSDGAVTPAKLSTGGITWSASGNVGVSGDIAFTKVGGKIVGNFTGANPSERTLFQTATVNGSTRVSFVPNGSDTTSAIDLYASSNAANCARLSMRTGAVDVAVVSAREGSGIYLPMTFWTGGLERAKIGIDGDITLKTNHPTGGDSHRLMFANSGGEFHLLDANGNVSTTLEQDTGNTRLLNVKSSGDVIIGNAAANTTGSLIFVCDNYTEMMRLNAKGVLSVPNQPFCRASRGTSTETFNVNTAYGILGSFHENTGNLFYQGGSVGAGGSVIHVPYTGKYLIILNVYKQGTTSGRINVVKNQTGGLLFVHLAGAVSDYTSSNSAVVSLNAADYINYKADMANATAFHAALHTQVTMYYLG